MNLKKFYVGRTIGFVILLFIVFCVFAFSEYRADSRVWKTYTDPTTGFSISYPPQYVLTPSVDTTRAPWGSRGLLSISDPADTSAYEFHVGPASVTLEKQPVLAAGKIYDTIETYAQSGIPDQMIQGLSKPHGVLVSVNDTEALLYHFPQGDATDAAVDDYMFIHDDLIYEVSFNATNPFEDRMLQSVTWQR